MILVDTGPFVALFDPLDGSHARCRSILREIREPLVTTTPVLTECFHMLSPESRGSDNLRRFVRQGGVTLFFLDTTSLTRAFELMGQYGDRPMDLADASLVAAAEALSVRKIFTLDRADFSTYRRRRGRRHESFEIVGEG